MKKKALMLVTLLLVCVLSLSACEKKTVSATDVIKAYYEAMNDKDYEKAMSYWYDYEEMTETEKQKQIELEQSLDVAHTLISVEPYSEWLTKQEKNFPPAEDEIKGTCETYIVKENAYYPSGWGAGPSGEYLHHYTMVKRDDAWRIFGSGAPMSHSCELAMKRISGQ